MLQWLHLRRRISCVQRVGYHPPRRAAARRTPARASFLLGVSLTAILSGAVAPTVQAADDPAAAWPKQCNRALDDNFFVGNGKNRTTGFDGVRATIEWANPRLCVQDPAAPDPSWSLSWVALAAPSSDGLNIYQGGIAKCGPSCPRNGGSSYYWYYWSREPGPCGSSPAETPFAKAPKGNAGPGSLVYQIQRETISGYEVYAFRISGVLQHTQSRGSLEVCWPPGPVDVGWENEMLDENDQNGGTSSNFQRWDELNYKVGSTWFAFSDLAVNSPCQANSHTKDGRINISNGWKCKISSTVSDRMYSWDQRAP